MPKKSVATPKNSAPDLLPPTNDVVFKHIFGDERNKDATAGLLSAILRLNIRETDISFGDPHLKREFPKDKLGVLDIFVRLKNGKTVAVEMLTGKFSNIFKRLEYYISKLTVAQLGKGSKYPEVKPVVFILITTEPVLKNTANYHSEFVMMEKNEHYVLHNLRTLHIIELSKLPPNGQGRLAAWLRFMLTRKKEDLMALVKKNPELKPAGEALMSASTVRAYRAWFSRNLDEDVDVLDRIDYAVKEAEKKAERKAKRTLSAVRRETEAALAEERRKAEKMLALLVKQGYSVDQVEKMVGKKRAARPTKAAAKRA